MSEMLVLKSVSKRWRRGAAALTHVSLRAEVGTITAIIGPSGAGKSTLLHVISGLTKYDSGSIHNPFGQAGMVFQEPSLWPHLTLLGNVSLPLYAIRGFKKPQARSKAAEILTSWGLGDRLEAYPAELSGGQQQRGALARAYVMEPKILCLDEVTSALDPETSAGILQTIRDWKANRITLMVTHHLGFAAASANQIIFMDGGAIVEAGPPRDVLANPISERARTFIAAAEMQLTIRL